MHIFNVKPRAKLRFASFLCRKNRTGTDLAADGTGRRFTMLELMIASVIMLLMMTMLFTISAAVTNSWQRLNSEKDHFMAVMALDRALDTMLSNVIPFRWRDSENNPAGSFQGEPDRMAFVYRHSLNSLEDGSLRNVILHVDDGSLQALYQSRPLLDLTEIPGPNAETTTLARGIERIELLYADWEPEQGIEWTDAWNPDGDRFEAPLGVRVDVFWQNGSRESWIRRTAGSGFDEQPGGWRPAP